MGIHTMSREEVSWLAGLFEGEGYLSRIKASGIRLGINMTDEDVIRRVGNLVGGQVYPRKRPASRPNWKPLWAWQLTNWPDVLELCALLLPWMGARRRAKMEEVIAEAAGDGRRKGSYKPCDFALGISNAGYIWHQKHGLLPACDSCMASYRLYMARWRADNRDKAAVYGATYRRRQQEGETSEITS